MMHAADTACACVLALAALQPGCGATARGATAPLVPDLRQACAEDEYWTGSECGPRGSGRDTLSRAAAALAEFRVDEALSLLERAQEQGPFAHADYVRMYEQLGIAYAYREREAEATRAFEMLLSLDPGHLLSYTLSPKATFLFERVRRKARAEAPPSVQITWPHGLSVSRQVPIDIEVIADPAGFLSRATLKLRLRGAADFRAIDLRLPPPGSYERVLLPAPRVRRPEVLEVTLTAMDATGNEVLVWPPERRAREIALAYHAPAPWYRKWWIWAIAGSALAVGTGTVVYIAGRDLPGTVGGVLEVVP